MTKKKVASLTKTHKKYQEIKDFAKQMYITPTAKGGYPSCQKIADAILKRYGLYVCQSTVRYWKENDIKKWEDLRVLSKITATTPSKSNYLTQEERLLNNVADEIAKIYHTTDDLSREALKVIKREIENNNLTLNSAIRLLKDCQEVKLKLLGIEQKHKIEVIDDRAERIRNMTPEEREGYKKQLISKLLEETDDEGLFDSTSASAGSKVN